MGKAGGYGWPWVCDAPGSIMAGKADVDDLLKRSPREGICGQIIGVGSSREGRLQMGSGNAAHVALLENISSVLSDRSPSSSNLSIGAHGPAPPIPVASGFTKECFCFCYWEE